MKNLFVSVSSLLVLFSIGICKPACAEAVLQLGNETILYTPLHILGQGESVRRFPSSGECPVMRFQPSQNRNSKIVRGTLSGNLSIPGLYSDDPGATFRLALRFYISKCQATDTATIFINNRRRTGRLRDLVTLVKADTAANIPFSLRISDVDKSIEKCTITIKADLYELHFDGSPLEILLRQTEEVCPSVDD